MAAGPSADIAWVSGGSSLLTRDEGGVSFFVSVVFYVLPSA